MIKSHLYESVSILPGVGKKKVEALSGLGIQTVMDLFYYFPYRYNDFYEQNIYNLQDNDKAVLRGTVTTSPILSRFGGKRSTLRFKMLVQDLTINVVFFNQPYLRDKITLGEDLAIYGKWEQSQLNLVGNKIIDPQETDRLEPIYSTSASMKQWALRKLIRITFDKYGSEIVDLIPLKIRQDLHLLPEDKMLWQIHFPKNFDEVKAARNTAIFEEFFLYLGRLRWLKKEDDQDGIAVQYNILDLKKFIQTLPFELTNSQKRAVNEICYDLKNKYAMNRLLQGDVGSGKTIVAALGIFATFTANLQSALMVPTEVLAAQHYAKLKKIYQGTSLRLELLTSGTSKIKREQILQKLITGEIDLIIGTHALIQDDVLFKNLAFVVIDEQHRFGVNQRRTLRVKGLMPNILSMTATPIPRTLAITIYGSIKISTIKEMPQGRIPIKTLWIKSANDPLINRASSSSLCCGSFSG